MRYYSFLITLGAVLLGLGVTACGSSNAAREEVAKRPAPVRVAYAAPAEFLSQIRTIGRVEPDRTYVLAFKTPGVVASLNVQEDGLRLLWITNLEFRRAQRDGFTFRVPAGYVIEKVTGPNVRGWQSRAEDAGQPGGGQRIDVTLLKPARVAGSASHRRNAVA